MSVEVPAEPGGHGLLEGRTVVITAAAGSGIISVNGAAAHLMKPQDLVILATFGEMDEEEAKRHVPKVVRVDAQNRIIGNEPERAGPQMPLHHLTDEPQA